MADPNRPKSIAPKQEGFTFLEVIVVMLIIGIVSVIAINRLQENRTQLVVRADMIKAQLRYAQGRAMNSNLVWGIHKDPTGINYNLFQYDPSTLTTTQARLPGEDNPIVDLSGEDINLVINPVTNDITFDAWGRPYQDGTATVQAVNPIVISLQSGSLSPELITITEETGFIP